MKVTTVGFDVAKQVFPLLGHQIGKGWFVHFRIYGPEVPAFDGSWKPGDFEKVK